MHISGLIAAAEQRLAEAGIEEAALDARLLFEHLTGLGRTHLVLHGDEEVAETVVADYRQLIERRSERVPLHHLTGTREFWSLAFTVSPAVLIPRPETEFLVECALAVCKGGAPIRQALDLCTGSGVIAVVLARELGCRVTAVDCSAEALAVAAGNVARHTVAGQVSLVQGDLFAPLAPTVPFDLIVSNPPYIVEQEIDRLEPEVALAEPRLALSGGADGLRVIARIAADAAAYLRPGGWLCVEIGADQGRSAPALFTTPGFRWESVRILDDWAGRPRVLQTRRVQ